ncbi:uncharacterized protein DS421_12g371310 [Arachis hypogaea]|nr:uncharacterized protein DS421_12g371310 [Arachis hypogaea]
MRVRREEGFAKSVAPPPLPVPSPSPFRLNLASPSCPGASNGGRHRRLRRTRREREGESHPRRRRSFHCRQKLPPSSQLLRWSSPVVNGCRRSGCGCRNHTGASRRFCHLRPRCRRRKTPLPPSRSNAVIVIGICRRCRLRWLPGCRRAGSETAAVLVQPFLLRFGKGFRFESPLVTVLLSYAEWLGTELLAAGISIVDLGLRWKGFYDAFGLWICVLR